MLMWVSQSGTQGSDIVEVFLKCLLANTLVHGQALKEVFQRFVVVHLLQSEGDGDGGLEVALTGIDLGKTPFLNGFLADVRQVHVRRAVGLHEDHFTGRSDHKCIGDASLFLDIVLGKRQVKGRTASFATDAISKLEHAIVIQNG